MKRNRLLTIALLALVLAVITSALVSETFSKYATSVGATGTLQVAKWKNVLKQGTTTITEGSEFALSIENNTDVSASRIAPGTNGSFTLDYDTTGSEVTHDVTIKLKSVSGKIPANMTFTNSRGTALSFSQTGDEVVLFTDSVPAGGAAGTVTVSWAWPFNNSLTLADTADGDAAEILKFKATFTAEQTDPDPIA